MSTKDFLIGLVVLLVVAVFMIEKGGDKTKRAKKEPTRPVVVIYVSEKRSVAEPILKDFEKESNITVKALYESETEKNKSLVNRLLAEKSHPKADLYWAADPVRAVYLKERNVTAPYRSPRADDILARYKDPDDFWTGFAGRARLFIVHDDTASVPHSIKDYTLPAYKGRGIMATPLHGSGAAHMAALFLTWGDDRAEAFLKALGRNDIALTRNDAESAELVAKGRFDFALVDSDELIGRIRRKAPVKIVYPDQKADETGCFVIPDTVMLIRGAPHEKTAKRLIDYLLDRKTEEKLARGDGARLPLRRGLRPPAGLKGLDEIKTLPIDYDALAKKLFEIRSLLIKWTTTGQS